MENNILRMVSMDILVVVGKDLDNLIWSDLVSEREFFCFYFYNFQLR